MELGRNHIKKSLILLFLNYQINGGFCMTQNNNANGGNNSRNSNNSNSGNNTNNRYQNNKGQNQKNNQKQNSNQRKERSPRSNFQKSSRNEFQKRSGQRYSAENRAARIVSPKREENVDDIKMDIEKLEKDIQFEIKQIQSIKLGL